MKYKQKKNTRKEAYWMMYRLKQTERGLLSGMYTLRRKRNHRSHFSAKNITFYWKTFTLTYTEREVYSEKYKLKYTESQLKKRRYLLKDTEEEE